jgi:hypothetical protein
MLSDNLFLYYGISGERYSEKICGYITCGIVLYWKK